MIKSCYKNICVLFLQFFGWCLIFQYKILINYLSNIKHVMTQMNQINNSCSERKEEVLGQCYKLCLAKPKKDTQKSAQLYYAVIHEHTKLSLTREL